MSYRSEVLADFPLAYWRLGETSLSDPVFDETLNGHNGQFQGAVVPGVAGLLVGDSNKAVDFPGTTADYISIPDSSLFVVPQVSGRISMEALVRLDTIGNRGILSGTQGGASISYAMFSDTGHDIFTQIRTLTGGVQNVSHDFGTPITGVVHHVVSTYNATNGIVKLYWDGVLLTTGFFVGGPTVPGSDLLIGKLTSNLYPWDGKLDEVAIYSTELSALRVLAHYAASIAAPTQPPASFRNQVGIFNRRQLLTAKFK